MIHPYAINTVLYAASTTGLPPYVAAALYEAAAHMKLANDFYAANCTETKPGNTSPEAWGKWQVWVTLLEAAKAAAWKAWNVGLAAPVVAKPKPKVGGLGIHARLMRRVDEAAEATCWANDAFYNREA